MHSNQHRDGKNIAIKIRRGRNTNISTHTHTVMCSRRSPTHTLSSERVSFRIACRISVLLKNTVEARMPTADSSKLRGRTASGKAGRAGASACVSVCVAAEWI